VAIIQSFARRFGGSIRGWRICGRQFCSSSFANSCVHRHRRGRPHSGRDNCSRPAIKHDIARLRSAERFEALGLAFGALAGCSRIWRIPLERQEADWKRNAGVSKTVERKQISLGRANPSLVKSNVEFLQVPLGKETLYFTPDAILVIAGAVVAAFRYNDVEIVSRQSRFVEDSAAPSDSRVVGETWRFLNRNGGPDRRFNNNRKLPICLYGEIDFKSSSGLNERIHCSRVDVSEGFASAVVAMRATDYLAASITRDSSSMVPVTFAPQQTGSSDTVDVGAAYAHERKSPALLR
jgi:hypothetical protein